MVLIFSRMDPRAFEKIALEELGRIPPRFARRVYNLAILIEETPSPGVCREEGLGEGDTLLGLYHGIPANERGTGYSGILPDTITLYRLPLLEEAEALFDEKRASDLESAARLAIRETLWHELGHHFGLSEGAVEAREVAGTNEFPQGTNGFDYAQGAALALWRPFRRGIMEQTFLSVRWQTGRVISLTVRMAKTLTLIFGTLFVLVGALGFVGNPLVGMDALFETDIVHNLVHLAIGLILLAVALSTPAQSAVWLKTVGVVYLIIGVLGLFTVSSGSLLGVIAVNSADNWLHLVLGVALIAAGLLIKNDLTDTIPPISSLPPPPPAQAV